MERIGRVLETQLQIEQMKPSHGLRRTSSVERAFAVMDRVQAMCLSRGQSMDPVRLELYSKVLCEEFQDDADTFVALSKVAMAKREDFEDKIPPLGELLDQVRKVGRERRIATAKAEVVAEEARMVEDRRLHPDKYFTSGDAMMNELYAEIAAKQARTQ